MTPSGIEPETLRLVAQCLNQLRHRVPHRLVYGALKFQRAIHQIRSLAAVTMINLSTYAHSVYIKR